MNYNFQKTLASTAKKNGFEVYVDSRNKKTLFDFSLLNGMGLDEQTEKGIKQHIMEYAGYDDYIWIHSNFDSLDSRWNIYSGDAYIKKYLVYGDARLLYIIFELVKIDIRFSERSRIWDEYTLYDEKHEQRGHNTMTEEHDISYQYDTVSVEHEIADVI